jgi:tetratricopeptide (TPR) repeat protein
LASEPNDEKAISLLSFIYYGIKKWNELAQLCENALAHEEEFEGFFDLNYLKAMSAHSYLMLKEYDKARWWARKAIEDQPPKIPREYFDLAAIEALSGNKEGYKEVIDKIAKMDPDAIEQAQKYIGNIKKKLNFEE